MRFRAALTPRTFADALAGGMYDRPRLMRARQDGIELPASEAADSVEPTSIVDPDQPATWQIDSKLHDAMHPRTAFEGQEPSRC